MIDGSVLQSAQRCFEKKSRVVVKMVVNQINNKSFRRCLTTKQFICLIVTHARQETGYKATLHR